MLIPPPPAAAMHREQQAQQLVWDARWHAPSFGGGIGIIQMLYRSNLLFLVGGGEDPRWQPTKLIIWNDAELKPIGEILMKTEIKGVRVKKQK